MRSNSDLTPRPIVTVALAVFNGEDYLAECIESILAQTLTDFEFIIVNDGSTDSSLKILENYADKDARISVISQKNQGLVLSKNRWLEVAEGKYIAIIDHDDLSLPDRLFNQVTYLDAHPEVVCVGGDSLLIDEKGRFLTRLFHLRGDEAIQAAALAGHGAITHPAAMIRTQVIRQINGYDNRYNFAEDLDLWLRLGEVGKLENLDVPVLKYRMHGKSISERKGELQREVAKNACEAAWERRGIAGEFQATGLWRPGASVDSKFQFALQYGWWAWNSGERKTATYYGCKAIRLKPFSKKGWVLVTCSFLRIPK